MVERKWKKENYTIGVLSVNGIRLCNSLEDKDRGLSQRDSLSKIRSVKVYGQTAIPAGRYLIDMDTVSVKFCNRAWAKPYMGKIPRLVGVPGFDGVLIHPGNKAEDTLGCILVGSNTVVGGLTKSQDTFHTLMKQYLNPASLRKEKIYITIK